MKLVTYTDGGSPRAGVITDRGILDAAALLGQPGHIGVRRLLADSRLEDLRNGLSRGGNPIALDGVTLLAPVPDPDKIVCIGLNYGKHAAEVGLETPEAPTIFAKYRNALAGDGATVALPEASTKVDYEAEIAFVIGHRATRVPAAEALDYVAGYTLFNDLSARDLQGLTQQWMAGKVFDGSAPCGPWLVTPDEAAAHDGLDISLTLNGETMQDSSTADLIFPVPELIAHLSSWMTLEPGDVIATGTPGGVGMARKPRVWLKPGDELVVRSSSLGELRTTIG